MTIKSDTRQKTAFAILAMLSPYKGFPYIHRLSKAPAHAKKCADALQRYILQLELQDISKINKISGAKPIISQGF